MHEADVANLIENLNPETRTKLIEIESFNIDPEIFIELNSQFKASFTITFYRFSYQNKKIRSDNAIKILENLSKEVKEKVLEKLPPKDKFLLQEGLVIQKTLLQE